MRGDEREEEEEPGRGEADCGGHCDGRGAYPGVRGGVSARGEVRGNDRRDLRRGRGKVGGVPAGPSLTAKVWGPPALDAGRERGWTASDSAGAGLESYPADLPPPAPTVAAALVAAPFERANN